MSQFPSIHATTPTGGSINITLYDPKGGDANVGGGAKYLGQAEMDAYRKAKHLMAQGKKAEAEAALQAAGFSL